jgi:hypothetical protein
MYSNFGFDAYSDSATAMHSTNRGCVTASLVFSLRTSVHFGLFLFRPFEFSQASTYFGLALSDCAYLIDSALIQRESPSDFFFLSYANTPLRFASERESATAMPGSRTLMHGSRTLGHVTATSPSCGYITGSLRWPREPQPGQCEYGRAAALAVRVRVAASQRRRCPTAAAQLSSS